MTVEGHIERYRALAGRLIHEDISMTVLFARGRNTIVIVDVVE